MSAAFEDETMQALYIKLGKDYFTVFDEYPDYIKCTAVFGEDATKLTPGTEIELVRFQRTIRTRIIKKVEIKGNLITIYTE